MQSTLGCLSRLVSRSLVTGVVNKDGSSSSSAASSGSSSGGAVAGVTTSAAASDATTKASAVSRRRSRLVTAVCGFPKGRPAAAPPQPQPADPNNNNSGRKPGYNIDNILNGQIGDDAYFVARHVDDWDSTPSSSTDSTTSDTSSPSSSPPSSSPVSSRVGVASADVIGVADGVGGWRQYGVDPGQFSSQLMYNCERLVKAGYFTPNQVQI